MKKILALSALALSASALTERKHRAGREEEKSYNIEDDIHQEIDEWSKNF